MVFFSVELQLVLLFLQLPPQALHFGRRRLGALQRLRRGRRSPAPAKAFHVFFPFGQTLGSPCSNPPFSANMILFSKTLRLGDPSVWSPPGLCHRHRARGDRGTAGRCCFCCETVQLQLQIVDHLVLRGDNAGQLIGVVRQEISLICFLICFDLCLQSSNFCISFFQGSF